MRVFLNYIYILCVAWVRSRILQFLGIKEQRVEPIPLTVMNGFYSTRPENTGIVVRFVEPEVPTPTPEPEPEPEEELPSPQVWDQLNED